MAKQSINNINVAITNNVQRRNDPSKINTPYSVQSVQSGTASPGGEGMQAPRRITPRMIKKLVKNRL